MATNRCSARAVVPGPRTGARSLHLSAARLARVPTALRPGECRPESVPERERKLGSERAVVLPPVREEIPGVFRHQLEELRHSLHPTRPWAAFVARARRWSRRARTAGVPGASDHDP